MDASKWLVVKPIGRPEFVIRDEQVYELNGPSQEGPCKVGIIHSYGKKEEVMIPITIQNYFELRYTLTGKAITEEEQKIVDAFKAPPPPPRLSMPEAPKPELKFEQ